LVSGPKVFWHGLKQETEMYRMLVGSLILMSLSPLSIENGVPASYKPFGMRSFSIAFDEVKDLSEVCERWASYWKEKDLDRLVQLYTSDAVFLTGSGDRFTGKPAIRELLKTAMATNNSDLKVRSIRTEISGNLAFNSGEYHETITPVNAGAKLELQGNYLIVFRKQKDGRWLIVEHMWTDKPVRDDK
jgi:uncharacterized protein (TIGR02246 family)